MVRIAPLYARAGPTLGAGDAGVALALRYSQCMDLVAAYRSIYDRLVDLATDLTAENIATTVIPTPDWSVKDTYSHLVGAIDDMITGTLDGYGTDAWTAVHVESRATHSLEEVCQEWSQRVSVFEALLESTGQKHVGLVAGSWTHEQDIRGSLGLKGVGDTGGMHATLELLDRLGPHIDKAGLPGTPHRGVESDVDPRKPAGCSDIDHNGLRGCAARIRAPKSPTGTGNGLARRRGTIPIRDRCLRSGDKRHHRLNSDSGIGSFGMAYVMVAVADRRSDCPTS